MPGTIRVSGLWIIGCILVMLCFWSIGQLVVCSSRSENGSQSTHLGCTLHEDLEIEMQIFVWICWRYFYQSHILAAEELFDCVTPNSKKLSHFVRALKLNSSCSKIKTVVISPSFLVLFDVYIFVWHAHIRLHWFYFSSYQKSLDMLGNWVLCWNCLLLNTSVVMRCLAACSLEYLLNVSWYLAVFLCVICVQFWRP